MDKIIETLFDNMSQQDLDMITERQQKSGFIPAQSRSVYLADLDLTVNSRSENPEEINYEAKTKLLGVNKTRYFGLKDMEKTSFQTMFGTAIDNLSDVLDKVVPIDNKIMANLGKGIGASTISLGSAGYRAITKTLMSELAINRELGKISKDFLRQEISPSEYKSLYEKRNKELDSLRYEVAQDNVKNANSVNQYIKELGFEPTDESPMSKFMFSLGAGSVSYLASIGSFAIFKNPALAIGILSMPEGQMAYEDAFNNATGKFTTELSDTEKSEAINKARKTGMENFLWIAGTEYLGTKLLFSTLNRNGILEKYAKDIYTKSPIFTKATAGYITEGGQEALQSVGTEVIKKINNVSDLKALDVIKNAIFEGVIGGVLGGITGGIASSVQIEDFKTKHINKLMEITDSNKQPLFTKTEAEKITNKIVSQDMSRNFIQEVFGIVGNERDNNLSKDARNPQNFKNEVIKGLKSVEEQIPEIRIQLYDVRDKAFERAINQGIDKDTAEIQAEIQQIRALNQFTLSDGKITPLQWYEDNLIDVVKDETGKLLVNDIDTGLNVNINKEKLENAILSGETVRILSAIKTKENIDEFGTILDSMVKSGTISEEYSSDILNDISSAYDTIPTEADVIDKLKDEQYDENSKFNFMKEESPEGVLFQSNQDLEQEARKYKSADEFVKAQCPVSKSLENSLNKSNSYYDKGDYLSYRKDKTKIEFGREELANGDDTLFLQDIYTEPLAQGKGKASKILKEITNYADKNNEIISLRASIGGHYNIESGLNQDKLIKWYEKNGFVKSPNASKFGVDNIFMVREPKFQLLTDIWNKAQENNTYFQDTSTQDKRGYIKFGNGKTIIGLLKNADKSTIIHELGHIFLRDFEIAMRNPDISENMAEIKKNLDEWLGKKEGKFYTLKQAEKFAKGFETYLAKGEAPKPILQTIFDNFKQWLIDIYGTVENMQDLPVNIKEMFDSMFAQDIYIPSKKTLEGNLEKLKMTAKKLLDKDMTEIEGIDIEQLRSLLKIAHKRIPTATPRKDLKKDIKRYGYMITGTSQFVDSNLLSNLHISNLSNQENLLNTDKPAQWLYDNGYLEVDDTKLLNTDELNEKAGKIINEALSGNKKVYTVADQAKIDSRQEVLDLRKMAVDVVGGDINKVQDILNQIVQLEKQGFRVVNADDLIYLQDLLKQTRELQEKQPEKDFKEIKKSLMQFVEDKKLLDRKILKEQIKNSKNKMELLKRIQALRDNIADAIIRMEMEQAVKKHQTVSSGQKIKQTNKLISGIFGFTKELIQPISSRLNKIDKRLSFILRTYEESLNLKNKYYKDKLVGFTTKMESMPEVDYRIFDLALKNSDTEQINAIAKKYNMEAELKQVRELLDEIYVEAANVGLKVGYTSEYFPRRVRNATDYITYMRGTPYWTNLENALYTQEGYEGWSDEEKADFINKVMRGYYTSDFATKKPTNIKERSIDIITEESDAFYYSTTDALIKYIGDMNITFEGRKFFGLDLQNLDESLGKTILELVNAKQITQQESAEIMQILKSRFNTRGTPTTWQTIKAINYAMTLANFTSTITQFQDLIFSVKFNGLFNTLNALISEKKITKESLGITHIIEEFSEKNIVQIGVDKTLKLTLFDTVDKIGKDTFINSAYSKYRKLANKNPDKLQETLAEFMGDKIAGDTIRDLRNDVVSDNVKYLLFNDLSNVQPISMSEMPQAYLDNPRGRIAYALKSFTIKQIDTLFTKNIQLIQEGKVAQGLGNMIYLGALFYLAGIPTDILKDLLMGRKISISDSAVDNLIKLFGLSKYHIYKAKQYGALVFLTSLLFPPVFSTTADFFGKEIPSVIKGKKKIEDLRTWSNIPLVGNFYYWYIGGGLEMKKKINKRRKRT